MALPARRRGGRKGGYQNVNRLRRKLRRMPETVTAPIKREITIAAQAIHAEAIGRAPVDTGELVARLKYRVARDGLTARIGILGKRDSRKVFYARFIEFGTKHQPARPFLFPAFEHERKPLVKRMKRAIDQALRRASKRGR